MIDSYRFFYESSRSLAGFPKAYLFSCSAAHWETSHCKYMSQKAIAFWAMHTLSTFLRIRTDQHADLLNLCHSTSLWYFLDVLYHPLLYCTSALLLYLLFRAVKKFLSIRLIMNSVRQWNSHQRHKFLRAHASRDISRIHISGRQVKMSSDGRLNSENFFSIIWHPRLRFSFLPTTNCFNLKTN